MLAHELRIAHTADLHLDSPFSRLPAEMGINLREEQRAYLSRLAEQCRLAEVDLLLMAGDLFDRPDADPLWIQRLLAALNELAPIPIYIVPGNHDPYYLGSLWDRVLWPEHVTIFREATTLVDHDLKLVVSGHPFTTLTARTELEQELEPDGDETPYPDNYIHIHMLHGELVSGSGSQSNYNPIHERDPAFDRYDYVALGHVHQTRTIERKNQRSTVLRYPGCPQGRGFDELGDKGFWIQTIRREETATGSWRTQQDGYFVSLRTRRFLIEQIDVTGLEDDASLSVHLLAELGRLAEVYGDAVLRKACLRLIFVGRRQAGLLLDLASLVEQAKRYGLDYVELRDETGADWPLDKLREESGFYGILLRSYDEERAKIEASGKPEEENAKAVLLLDKALEHVLEVGDRTV